MFSLEMLTKAADLVETQEKQKRLMESPSPENTSTDAKKVSSNHVGEEKPPDSQEVNGNAENHSNGTAENRRHDHASQNGSAHGHDASKESPGADSATTVNNHDGKGNKDEVKSAEENNLVHRPSLDLSDPARYYQQRVAEQANGLQARGEKIQRTEENPGARISPERFQRRSSSPAADRSGDTHPATKPMVLLHHPSATTLSSVGSANTVPLTNPGLHASTMHHPYLYSLMYPAGAAALDPTLSALARVPGGVLKEGEGQTSSPNGSPNPNLAAASAGLHFPAHLMYPLANPALLMGPRPPGTVADVSPLLLAPSSAAGYPVLDQYKRFFEGMHQFSAYPLQQPQLADQYLKSIAAGHSLVDGNKDALALNALAGRLPPGLSQLAALQGQAGAADSWLRYPEQISAAMGMLRPQDGLSPRAGSPYSVKRRTDSPVVANGGKIATSNYPFHPSLGQQQMSALSDARAHATRSPAAAIFSQAHRSRSPGSEVRKPEVERSGYRSHSRDLEKDVKPAAKELASTSTSSSHIRTNNEHLAAHSYSVTDLQTGRKIARPPFYDHVPPGYPLGLRQPAQGRSPSPRSRTSEANYHRPSRDRSPVDMQTKRRSLDSQFVARNSPILNDRRNSRPTSPATNGLSAGRPQLPLVNGSAETAVAAELAKANHHLLLSSNHRRSPNANAFGAEGREPRNGSPAPNPSYLTSGMPYLAPNFLTGLASSLMLPQYAQALAASSKGADLALPYKPGENALSIPLFLSQHQQLIAAGRSTHVLPQAHPYIPTQPGAKESGKASPGNGRDKIAGLPQQLHQTLLGQHPPQALSPGKVGLKPKHSPSPQLPKPGHHPHIGDSHSPPGLGNNALSSAETRRYQSPSIDRPARESSPKPSNKPYRPNSMLRQHAEDLERSRKRKIMEEEIAMREGGTPFVQEKHHPRPEQRDYTSKDSRKDPKRRKQLISEADPDDHFRRSLGKDYESATTNKVHISGNVDDHFKKALGLMYDSIQTTAPKSEARDPPALTTHSLPSYSAAMASVTQSPRAYPPPHHPDGKEPIASRVYDPAFLARERYYVTNLPPHHRKAEKSPPRGPAAAVPTVLYPPNPPIGPVRQRVKAKSYVPEAPVAALELTNNRSVRAISLGSKGSTRTISGSSAESIPAMLAKSPTTSPTTSAVPDTISRPPISAAIPTIPYTFPHQQSAASTAVASHVVPPVTTSEAAMLQRNRSSSTSPPRGPPPEESSQSQSTSPRNTVPQEPRERTSSGEGKPST